MQTAYQFIPVTGQPETFTAQLPKAPGYTELEKHIRPLIGSDFERVAVIFNGKQTDMFVDDCGRLKALPLNRAATDIYRAGALLKEPTRRPETLAAIYGPAVLFARPVWC